MVTTPFKPLFYLRDPIAQSLLGAFTPTTNPLETHRKEIILQGEDKFEYFVTPPKNPSTKQYIIVMHAWLGSAFMPYVLAAAKRAHALGYGVIRAHLRDHGGNERLTKKPFHTARTEEFNALMLRIAKEENVESYAMVTFSISASYGLRFATTQPKGLQALVAISPYIYLHDALKKIDGSSDLQRWFLYQGLRGMVVRKSKTFPHLYSTKVLKEVPSTCYDAVSHLATKVYGFSSAKEYYDLSDLRKFPTENISVPLMVIVSKDDPISDIANYPEVRWPKQTELHYAEKGGHIGFLHQQSFPDTGHRWAQYEALEFIRDKF